MKIEQFKSRISNIESLTNEYIEQQINFLEEFRTESTKHIRGSQNKSVHFVIHVSWENSIAWNYASLKLERSLRLGIERLKRDSTVSNVRRYDKKNWGSCALFEKNGKTYMISTYCEERGKFEIYLHNENEYSLSRSNIKIAA